MVKRLAKFVIDNLIKDVLTSAGNQIGESIGKRIGSKIYQEPEKDEDAKETDDKEQEADDRGGKPEEDPETAASWTRRLLTNQSCDDCH